MLLTATVKVLDVKRVKLNQKVCQSPKQDSLEIMALSEVDMKAPLRSKESTIVK